MLSLFGKKSKKGVENAIFTITPYFKDGLWMFDDDKVGLIEEPFVAGADVAMDMIIGRRYGKDDSNKSTLVFSQFEMPDAGYLGKFISGNISDGTWYNMYSRYGDEWLEQFHYFWLCPALGKYFKHSPESLYCKVVN